MLASLLVLPACQKKDPLALQIIGNQLCDGNGDPIQLRGLSTHNMVSSRFRVNEGALTTLRDDWGINVFRLAMYTNELHHGYPYNKDMVLPIAESLIELCIQMDLYVIMDWHILYDGDPNIHKAEAIEFFDYISKKYGEEPRLIYEICNEPNNAENEPVVDWDNCIKPYAEEVVAAIRKNDPDNIIIIGSSNYSQDCDIASENPVEGTNLMYTVHFYAGTHGQWLRDKVQKALDNGVAVFITEWGTTDSSGAGQVYAKESDEWLDFAKEKNLSWCNWSYGSDAIEGSNALYRPAANDGNWPDDVISESGLYVRDRLRKDAGMTK